MAPEILTRKGYDGASMDVWLCSIVLFALDVGSIGDNLGSRGVSSELKNLITRLLDMNTKTRITLDKIMRDTWFNRVGYMDNLTRPEIWEGNQVITKSLNAFDLTSFSLEIDISGLFTDPKYLDSTD
ncbi:CBL-interacting serine/threonine-protein kinase 11 [Glycine max]|nr:CBL-interacting serine/threonine-protein kinase 11 [Glycine max]